MDSKQLVFNSVECLECGVRLISHHRHDYRTCQCPNQTMVDGGTSYTRYGGKDMSKVKGLFIYDDEPFEIVREYAERGGRGEDGDKPLEWIKVKDMSDDYVLKVIEYGGPIWHLEIMKKELLYRFNNNISII